MKKFEDNETVDDSNICLESYDYTRIGSLFSIFLFFDLLKKVITKNYEDKFKHCLGICEVIDCFW